MTISSTNPHAVAVRLASYCHGTSLASAADEARKSTQGRHMIRERVMAMGKDSIYNLTGLVRTFPLQPQELEPLENQFTDNQLIARERAVGSQTGPVVRRGRLGGLLSYYHREVA